MTFAADHPSLVHYQETLRDAASYRNSINARRLIAQNHGEEKVLSALAHDEKILHQVEGELRERLEELRQPRIVKE